MLSIQRQFTLVVSEPRLGHTSAAQPSSSSRAQSRRAAFPLARRSSAARDSSAPCVGPLSRRVLLYFVRRPLPCASTARSRNCLARSRDPIVVRNFTHRRFFRVICSDRARASHDATIAPRLCSPRRVSLACRLSSRRVGSRRAARPSRAPAPGAAPASATSRHGHISVEPQR